MIKPLKIPTVLGAGCVLAVSSLAVVASSAASTVTLSIHCSQNIIDAPHRVTLTVRGPSGATTSVAHTAPALSSSDSIAADLAANLTNAGLPATAGETSHPSLGPGKAQDVSLAEGHEVVSAKVEKLSEGEPDVDDGHLKVHQGEKKISNPQGGGNGGGFDSIHLTLNSFTGAPLAMSIDLYGEFDGRSAEWHKDVNYGHGPVQPQLKLIGIGSYLDSLGFTVVYPSGNKMLATAPPAEMEVEVVYFTVYEHSDANSPGEYEVSYSMEVD